MSNCLLLLDFPINILYAFLVSSMNSYMLDLYTFLDFITLIVFSEAYKL